MPFARDSQMIVHSEGMLGPICPAASLQTCWEIPSSPANRHPSSRISPDTISRLVFTDAGALRQCRSGWMTRYRELSGRELTRGTRIRFMRWAVGEEQKRAAHMGYGKRNKRQ